MLLRCDCSSRPQEVLLAHLFAVPEKRAPSSIDMPPPPPRSVRTPSGSATQCRYDGPCAPCRSATNTGTTARVRRLEGRSSATPQARLYDAGHHQCCAMSCGSPAGRACPSPPFPASAQPCMHCFVCGQAGRHRIPVLSFLTRIASQHHLPRSGTSPVQ